MGPKKTTKADPKFKMELGQKDDSGIGIGKVLFYSAFLTVCVAYVAFVAKPQEFSVNEIFERAS